MKNSYWPLALIFIGILLFFAKQNAKAQPTLQNLGDRYRIGCIKPAQPNYPIDSASYRVTVICPSAMIWEVNNLKFGQSVEYNLGGINYISVAVYWWEKGKKVGQKSYPTICQFFTNPVNCFKKI